MPQENENEIVLETIDDTIMIVRAADDISGDAKDGLISQLRAAKHAVNGAPDKVQALAELVAIRTIAEAQQAIRLPGQVKAQAAACVAAHATACAGAKVSPQVDPNSKLGIFLACINSWPLAVFGSVAFFAPNAPAIIDKLTAVFK